MSPRLQRLAVSLSSQMPFASAAKTLIDLLPSAPKLVTLHRLLGQMGERREAESEELRRRIFESGEIVKGERQLSRLFIEADGEWIHLQRTPGERNLEVRVGVAHEGWEAAEIAGRTGCPAGSRSEAASQSIASDVGRPPPSPHGPARL